MGKDPESYEPDLKDEVDTIINQSSSSDHHGDTTMSEPIIIPEDYSWEAHSFLNATLLLTNRERSRETLLDAEFPTITAQCKEDTLATWRRLHQELGCHRHCSSALRSLIKLFNTTVRLDKEREEEDPFARLARLAKKSKQ